MIEGLIGVIGLMLGMAAASVWWMHRRAISQQSLANAEARARSLDEQMQGMRADGERARGEIAQANAARERAEKDALAKAKELESNQRQFEEQKQTLQEAEKRLVDTFAALSARSLAANNQQFLDLAKKSLEAVMVEAKGDVEKKQQAIDNLLKPIRELLDQHGKAVSALEQKREGAYARLDEQIKAIASSHGELRTETGRLVTALRRPEVRGRWGEMQLRNVVELAGMTPHCDFFEQQTVHDDDGAPQRPDMLIRLPRGGVIIIDAKVALNAYLDAQQPDADRESCLRSHARQTADHARKLAAKRYWDQFERAPNIVVMFVPLESALAAAVEALPELQSDAMRSRVLIATPISLLGLLHTIAYGWQQEREAENARAIALAGAELYQRLSVLADSIGRVGAAVSKTAAEYNKLIGTLESRVLPGARRLKDLQALPDPEIPESVSVEIEMRPIVAPELQQQPMLIEDVQPNV